MPTRRRLQNEIRRLLEQYDAEIQEAFLAAIRRRKDGINLRELASAIEARDFNRALNIAGITRGDLFPFDTSITGAYAAGGQTVPAAAPAFAASFGFDGRADRAVAWARDHVGGLVTAIVDEQLDMLRETIGDGLSEGRNPRDVALEIAGRVGPGNRRSGGFIGLNKPQRGYVYGSRRPDGSTVPGIKQELENLDTTYFQRKLRDRRFDGTVRKAIREGKLLSAADRERITGRYADRLLKHRADTIARTESITALRAGRREGIQQGIEAGAINPQRIRRVWSATLDGRTREDHREVHGQSVDGMEAPFVLPDGSRLLYPGDTSLGAAASQTISCRCYDEYVIDWLRP